MPFYQKQGIIPKNDMLFSEVERRMNELYPDKYFPMYSIVSFSDIDYYTALKKGQEQDEIIKSEIIKFKINSASSHVEIDNMVHQFLGVKVK